VNRGRRTFLAASALAGATLVWGCSHPTSTGSITLYHLPKRFSRRGDDLTANITGRLEEGTHASYRLNGGPWREIQHGGPRNPEPFFTIEIPAHELETGRNELELRCNVSESCEPPLRVRFEYDPSPIDLPLTVNWRNADLNVDDGAWETFEENGQWRVRPRPGFEDYDRVLIATGAFAGGRRVRTDMQFLEHSVPGRPYGFGVLPMWGGRPDDRSDGPRRGWSFSLCWYYSTYHGIGSEFSYKVGDGGPEWASTYQDFVLEPGRRVFLDIEVWPESTKEGRGFRYVQRFRLRRDESAPWGKWLTLTDTVSGTLPRGEYAVALVAHRCQVNFGPILVEALDI